MRDGLREQHRAAQVVVALVTFSTPARARDHRDRLELPFPVLVDPDRSVYRAYGLGRGSVGRVWGGRTLRRYAEIVARGGVAGLRRPSEDTLQLGGDFVIAPDGTLAWGFWSEGPDDRPTVDELVDVVGRL